MQVTNGVFYLKLAHVQSRVKHRRSKVFSCYGRLEQVRSCYGRLRQMLKSVMCDACIYTNKRAISLIVLRLKKKEKHGCTERSKDYSPSITGLSTL